MDLLSRMLTFSSSFQRVSPKASIKWSRPGHGVSNATRDAWKGVAGKSSNGVSQLRQGLVFPPGFDLRVAWYISARFPVPNLLSRALTRTL